MITPSAPGGSGGAADRAPIRVTVVGGYLGAGKTTLVNSVLRRADERIAVLVNDFGEVVIDAALIESNDGDVMQLANGCICCSLVDGFAAALSTIEAAEPRPERLLIEASGVSDPAAVAAYGHAPGLAMDAVLVVADAETFRARRRDRYVGDTVVRQLAAADIIVLNKVSLAGEEPVAEARAWLHDHHPGVAVVEIDHGDVPLDVVFGPGFERTDARPTPTAAHDHDHPGHGSHASFETWTVTVERPITAAALEEAMGTLPSSVVRAKGIVHLAGEPTPHVLQRVGARWSLTPRAGGTEEHTVIVLIGAPGALDVAALERHLRSAG